MKRQRSAAQGVLPVAPRPSTPTARLLAIIEAQTTIVGLIARGSPLSVTLAQIAALVDRLAAPAICSILLLDDEGVHLRHGAAPGLPEAYCRAIDGVAIGPSVGSCGTAAFRREPVIVRDIASDPLWAEFSFLALSIGLRACWSLPIVDDAGRVLATFALYYREPRDPDPSDWQLVEIMAGLVRVALVQHRREEVLQASEARLRDFAVTASDWFWEQDADLRFTYLSETHANITVPHHLGKTRREVVFHGVSEAQWADHQAELLARRPFRDFRFQRIGSDGKIHHISINGDPVFGAAGEFKGYRGTGRDITAQVLAEHEIRHAKEEAEAANLSKTQFLANVSHELRTPLNAIIGFSEIMGREMFGTLAPRYLGYAADIHRSGQYLLAIINDILDLSKIEAGRLDLHKEATDVNEIIEASVEMLAARARETGVKLRTRRAPHPMLVRGDKLRLTQVLVNVLSNAVKFTPSGKQVVVAAALETDVPGSDTSGDQSMVISVADEGIGMRPEDIPIALQPFRQIDNALSRRFEGTGLGLPLAKALIDLHGGRLSIESAVGVGTTVVIRVPAMRAARAGYQPELFS